LKHPPPPSPQAIRVWTLRSPFNKILDTALQRRAYGLENEEISSSDMTVGESRSPSETEPGWESNPRPSAHKADQVTRLAKSKATPFNPMVGSTQLFLNVFVSSMRYQNKKNTLILFCFCIAFCMHFFVLAFAFLKFRSFLKLFGLFLFTFSFAS
jgi:hypothetical protein